MKRLHEFDALRGIAAFCVVIAHVLNYAPATMADPLAHPGAVVWSFAANGHFAVLVFFTISGFVLSYPYFSGDKTGRNLALDALNRLPRLMIPVFLAALLCYGVQALAGQVAGAAQIAPFGSPDWIARWDVEGWTLGRAVQFLLAQVFFGYDEARTFNVNLWTMPVEFAFSFLVFGIVAAFLRNIPLAALLTGIGIVAILSWRSGPLDYLLKGIAGSTFFLGVLVAYFLDRIRRVAGRWRGAPHILMIAGLGLSSVLLNHSLHYLVVDAVGLAAVALFFVGFSCAPRLRSALDRAGWRTLGELSFALYLLHGSVLYLVFQVIAAHADGYGMPEFIAGALVSVALSLAMAFVFARYVERPLVGWVRHGLRRRLQSARIA